MRVETDHSGTELVTFGSIAAVVLAGVLPWVEGGASMMPVGAAVTVVCGLAAGGIVLYGNDTSADDGALLVLGATVTVLAVRAFGRFSVEAGGFGGVTRSPALGVFLAALGGLALAGVAAHECWNAVAVDGKADSPAEPAD
jgi:hypothetical protein